MLYSESSVGRIHSRSGCRLPIRSNAPYAVLILALNPPPIYMPLVGDDGKATMPWILFFNQNFTGDTGKDWTPSFVSLASTGTPTFSGRIYKVSDNLLFFTAVITPATDTTSTAGTTYIANPPFTILRDGTCSAAGGNVGSLTGMCTAATNRIFVPAWTSAVVPITVTGLIEAS